MAKDKAKETTDDTPPWQEEATLPGMKDVGKLPSDVVRAAIHRRLTLRDALPDDPEFKAKFRFLWEWLTFQEVSEDKAKDRSTLIVKISEGAWTVALTDPAMAATLAATGRTLEACLEQLDEHLGDPDAPWVPSRKKEAKLKDRKRK